MRGNEVQLAPPRDTADCSQWIRSHAQAHGFTLDEAQERALEHFARLYGDLIGLERLEASLIRLLARKRVVRGLYVWGGVGRGKSFLMDSFYACAAVGRKQRIHFHRFMQQVHRALHEKQGQADPLAAIARDLAKDARLLCLDEFHITDITDAMVMKRLLEALFEQGVVLVTTSNFEPDALYLHGLQRNQFLPAIDLIRQNLEVVNIDAGIDYRLRELERAGVYHTEENADAALEEAFAHIASEEPDECGRDRSGRPDDSRAPQRIRGGVVRLRRSLRRAARQSRITSSSHGAITRCSSPTCRVSGSATQTSCGASCG